MCTQPNHNKAILIVWVAKLVDALGHILTTVLLSMIIIGLDAGLVICSAEQHRRGGCSFVSLSVEWLLWSYSLETV